ncbi:hypothetical protein pb186bvf_020686 [Paramecium bursaria]
MITALSLLLLMKMQHCQKLNSFNYRIYRFRQELLPTNVEKYILNPMLSQDDDCYLTYDGQRYNIIQDIIQNRTLFKNDQEFQVSIQIQNLAEQTFYCSGKVFFIKSPFYLDLNITFQKPVYVINYCNLQFYAINRLILSNMVFACSNQQNMIDIEALDIHLDRLQVLQPIQLIIDEFFDFIELTNIEIIDVNFTFPFISLKMLKYKQISQFISIKNMQLKKVNIANTTFIDIYQDKDDFTNKFQLALFKDITLQFVNVKNSTIFSTYGYIKLVMSNIKITSSIFEQSPIFVMNIGHLDQLVICNCQVIEEYLIIFNSITLSNSQFNYLVFKKLSSLFHQKTLELNKQQISIVRIYNSFLMNIDLYHSSRILSITSEDNMLNTLILKNINIKYLRTFGDYDTYLFIIYSQNVSISKFTSLMNAGIISDFYIQSSFLKIDQMLIDGNNQNNQTVDSNNLNYFIENKQYRKQLLQIQSDQWVQIKSLHVRYITFFDDQPIFIQLSKTSQDHIYLEYVDLLNNILIYTQIPEYYKSFIGIMSYSYSETSLQHLKINNNIIYDKHGEKSRDHILMIYSPTVYIIDIALKFNQITNSGGSTLYVYSIKLAISQCDIFLTSYIEIIDNIIQLKDIMYLKIQKLKLVNSKQIPFISLISDIHKITEMNRIFIFGNIRYQSSQIIVHKSKSPLSIIVIEGCKISNIQPVSNAIIEIQQESQKCLISIKDTILINSFSQSQVTLRLNQISDIGEIVINKLYMQGTITLQDLYSNCMLLSMITTKIIITDIIISKNSCSALQITKSQYLILKQGIFHQNQYSSDMPFISINQTRSLTQTCFENLKFLENRYNPKDQSKSNVLIYLQLNKISHLILRDVIIAKNKVRQFTNQDIIYINNKQNIGLVKFQNFLIYQNECDNCINLQGVRQVSNPLKIQLLSTRLINNNSTNLIKIENINLEVQETIIQQISKLKWIFYNQHSMINVNQCELMNVNNNIFQQIDNTIQFTDNQMEILDDTKVSMYQTDQILQQLVISFDSGHSFNYNHRNITDNNIIDISRFKDLRYFYLPSGQKIGQYKYVDLKHRYIQGLRVLAHNKHKQEILQFQQCNISSINSNLNIDHFRIGSESQDLDELILTMNPYFKLIDTLIIQCPSLEDKMNYQLHMLIKTLPCQAGEYLYQNQCLICDYKLHYYTLIKHQTQCQLADNSIIDGVQFSQISLKQNYWRPYQNSSNIERCEPQTCIGGWSAGNNLCKTGRSGAICQECDLNNENGEGNFGRYIKGCYSCDNQNYLDAVFQLICIICLQIILMITTAQSNHKQYLQLQKFKWISKQFMILNKLSVDQSGICIKMLIGHIQIIYLINNSYLYNFSFNLTIILITNPIKVTSFYFDCFLQQHVVIDRELYTELIIQFVHPLIILNIYILILLIFIKLQFIKYNISFITTAVIFQYFYNVLPLFQKLASLFTYKLLSGLAWVNSNYSYLFFSNQHLKKVYFYITPISVIFAVIIPIMAILYLTLIRNNMYNSKNYLIFGFVYRDYKQEAYLWEFVRLIYKLMLVSTIYFFINDQQYKFLIILLIIIGFSDLNRRYQPYNLKNLNQYEQDIHQYNNYCIIIIIFGQYFENQNEPFQYIIGMIYYTINLYLFLKYGLMIIRLFIKQNQWATDKIKSFITQKFPKLGNKAILQQSQISRDRVKEQFKKIQSLYKIQSQNSTKLTQSKSSNGTNHTFQVDQNLSITMQKQQQQTNLQTEGNLMSDGKIIKSEIELMQLD